MAVNFSIIIPHYNIPNLLMRCLKSIPVRDDIQVIVVDDCSPDFETYKERYPELSRPYLELYQTPKGGSAGRARNVGLEHAKGEWLIFLDADDMFVNKVENILADVLKKKEDIIHYDTVCVMSDDISKLSNRNFYHQYFEQYLIDKNETSFRYRFHSLWGKVYRADFVKKYGIHFDETKYSNDVLFAVSAGIYAQRISVIQQDLFIVTERAGSLASNQFKDNVISKSECRTRLDVAIGVRELLERNHIFNEERQVEEYLGKLRALYKSTYYQYLVRLLLKHPSYVISFIKKDIRYILKKLHIMR